MLAVNRVNELSVEKWPVFKSRGGSGGLDEGSENFLGFDETFFDIPLPGLVISHAALRLLAGEV